jgi:hypothetical protein
VPTSVLGRSRLRRTLSLLDVGPVTRLRGSGRREGARHGARLKGRPQLALGIARARAGTPEVTHRGETVGGEKGDDRQTLYRGEPVSPEMCSGTFACVYEVPGSIHVNERRGETSAAPSFGQYCAASAHTEPSLTMRNDALLFRRPLDRPRPV